MPTLRSELDVGSEVYRTNVVKHFRFSGTRGKQRIHKSPSQVHVAAVMVLVGLAGVLAVLTGVWLMITSVYGFVQLASRQSIRQTAH